MAHEETVGGRVFLPRQVELWHYGSGAGAGFIPPGQGRLLGTGTGEAFNLGPADSVAGEVVSVSGSPTGTITLQTSTDGVTWSNTSSTATLTATSTTWGVSPPKSTVDLVGRLSWTVSGGSFIVTGRVHYEGSTDIGNLPATQVID